jgi:cell division protein FtsB
MATDTHRTNKPVDFLNNLITQALEEAGLDLWVDTTGAFHFVPEGCSGGWNAPKGWAKRERQKKLDNLEAESNTLLARIHELKKELSGYKQVNEKLTIECSARGEETVRVSNLLSQLDRRHGTLNWDYKKLAKDYAYLEESIKPLREDYEKLVKDYAALEERFTIAENRIKPLEAKEASLKPKRNHYDGSVHPLDLIAAKGYSDIIGFCRGNVIKYVYRYDRKGDPLGDLRKASTYLKYLTTVVEFKESNPKTELPPGLLRKE